MVRQSRRGLLLVEEPRFHIDLGQHSGTLGCVKSFHCPIRWRERRDEKCQTRTSASCGALNCRPVVPSLLARDDPIGIPRSRRSESWATTYTDERSRGQPQSSSSCLLRCGRGRRCGSGSCSLRCVSLSEGVWVLSVSALLINHARGSFPSFELSASDCNEPCDHFPLVSNVAFDAQRGRFGGVWDVRAFAASDSAPAPAS